MCPSNKDDFDRDDRPSWIEIDKMREKSSHRKEKSEARQSPKEAAWVKTAAVKEANKLFNKKLSPSALKMLDLILDAQGKPEFTDLADQYINKYGFPDDWTVMLAFLDHPDEGVFEKVAHAMAAVYQIQKIAARRSFKSKLSILSSTSFNSRIRQTAAKIKSTL